jgi:hypothetical protein
VIRLLFAIIIKYWVCILFYLPFLIVASHQFCQDSKRFDSLPINVLQQGMHKGKNEIKKNEIKNSCCLWQPLICKFDGPAVHMNWWLLVSWCLSRTTSCVQPSFWLRANLHSLHYGRDCCKRGAQKRNKPRWERDPGSKRCWNVLSISLCYKGHLCLMPLFLLYKVFENWLEFETLIFSLSKLFHSLMQKLSMQNC